jgi:hypothetical protein
METYTTPRGGEEVGHVVRLHHFHGATGSPSRFLDDLAGAAERDDKLGPLPDIGP